MVDGVKEQDAVKIILAKGNEGYFVYQVCWTICESCITTLTTVQLPKGIKDSTMQSEDGVNSLNIVTLHTVLHTLAPWGFEPGELHFVLVPTDSESSYPCCYPSEYI